MAEFTTVPDTVVHLVEELITAHHPHLNGANIGLLFRDEPAKSQGQTVAAKAELINDKWRSLFGRPYDFLITIAEPIWHDLTASQRRALLDHELCHCIWGKNGWTIRGHDFEEFNEIIQRHGLWRDQAVQMARAMQPRLPLGNGRVDAIPASGGAA